MRIGEHNSVPLDEPVKGVTSPGHSLRVREECGGLLQLLGGYLRVRMQDFHERQDGRRGDVDVELAGRIFFVQFHGCSENLVQGAHKLREVFSLTAQCDDMRRLRYWRRVSRVSGNISIDVYG